MNRSILFLCLCSLTGPLAAAPKDLTECAGIAADTVRLACYDRIVREAPPEKQTATANSDSKPPPSPVSALSEHWELDPQSKAGTFRIRAHHPTYFLPLFVTDNVNRRPTSPAPGRTATARGRQRDSEAKYQISFKTKLAEDLFDGRSDLWFGYTQQSHWQLYNQDTSRDFRGTDYQPELILTTRTDFDVLGWRGRFVNLGLLHQSNGSDEPLSRSWNRIYAQVGLERGDWALLLRPWWRLPEHNGGDNPDITRFMGHGDVTAMWKRDDHVVSLLARRNLGSGKGALQADWGFPILPHLRGHLQLFSGYGESLLDYNHRQTTIGIGVSLSEGL